MVAFKIIYLSLTLTISFALLRSLIGNWHNYAKSQRFYMIGFLVMLAGMTQRAFGQLLNEDPYAFSKSGLITVGLAIIAFGMKYGRDPRLQEPLETGSPEDLNKYIALLQQSQKRQEEN